MNRKKDKDFLILWIVKSYQKGRPPRIIIHNRVFQAADAPLTSFMVIHV